MTSPMRMVPVEPTEAMWRAGERAFDRDPDVHHETVIGNIWSAMLAVSPPPGELRELVESLVAELTPDQGERASTAFGIAVRLQQSLIGEAS